MKATKAWACFDIHGIIRLRTNLWFSNLPAYFQVPQVVPNFEFELVRHLEIPDDGRGRRAIGFTAYDLGDGEILFECEPPILSLVGARTPWRLIVKDVAKDRTRLVSAVPFFDFSPIRFKARQILSKLARQIFTIKLIRSGFAVCYATAVSRGDRAHLFLGYSGTGKSTIASMMMDRGYEFLADDFVIGDSSGKIYCYPDWHKPHTMRSNMPLKKYLAPGPSSGERVPRVRREAKIDTIMILERGSDNIVELDQAEALRRIQLINSAEVARLWNNPLSVVLNHYSYFYPELDVEGLMAQNRKHLMHFVQQAVRYVSVRSRSPDFRNVEIPPPDAESLVT